MSKLVTAIAAFAIAATSLISGGSASATAMPTTVVGNDIDGDTYIADDCAPLNPAVSPGAVDRPDLAFVDSNCDGIDGDESDAIFVSLGGNDSAPGTKTNPKRTISAAIAAAAAAGNDVYVAGGEYLTEPPGGVPLADNVGVYGGYAPITGVRSADEVTRIKGAPAVLAVGDQGIVLQQLNVQGLPDGNRNSYGLRVVPDGVTPSQILLENVRASADPAGAATHGANGPAGAAAAGSFGGAGGSGGCGTGSPGQFGGAGGPAGANGSNGPNNGLSLPDAATWLRPGASSGSFGIAGGGGAGGHGGAGASGFFGSPLCGGQGGAGGRGGGSGFAGGGGQTGAGSFGAFVYNSSLVAVDSVLIGGNGGDGGNGGNGGNGGLGGPGLAGAPGECENVFFLICASPGAPGSAGSAGGRGGGGGGAVGGPSAGIYQAGDQSGYTNQNSIEQSGTGGAGGLPGNGVGARAATGQSTLVLRTASAPPTAATDFDGDAINDSADACASIPGGAADVDGNGCPEPPQTSITSGPANNSFALSTGAAFGLASNENSSTFTCSLDGGAGTSCTSPREFSNLVAKTHTLSVWAHDGAGDADPTAATRTWTVPRDNTALGHSAGWSKKTGAGYYRNSYSTSTKKGAALSTSVSGARRIALVATRGPGHGKVKVFLGSTLLRTVDLAAGTLRKKQLIPITTFASPRNGTLRIVVATSGKAVRVEGLGIATR